MYFEYDFTNRMKQGFYWMEIERLSFCQVLSPRTADLLDLVMAIYAADRQSRRDFKEANTGQRSIHVRVGVRDLQFWTESGIAQRLKEFLYWLSEDVWSFNFDRRQAAPTIAESERFLFRFSPDPPVTVSLFSGGLDSLAGLAAHARENPSKSYFLVSGYTQNRLASLQSSQVQHIRSAWRGGLLGTIPTIGLVAVPFGIHPLKKHQEEKGQRTRALVFLTFGAVAALQADSDTLWVYENGIGALNLPLNETQLGVDNYRGVHPRSLMMAEKLFELVLEQPVRIRNPFLFHTKAEMCKALKPAGLASAVQLTVSCDSFPLRLHGKPSQCGYCTSCVLRRQSLLAAGYEGYAPGDTYLYDVLTSKANTESKRFFGLEVMREQVYKLARCLDSDDPWHSLTVSFPELLRTHSELVVRDNLDADDTRARFVNLFQTYVQEWKSFPGTL